VVAGAARKFGVSGALLAAATGKLLVPLSHNAGDFWPRRGLLKKPGTVRVIIGEPIAAAGKNARDLTAEVRRAVEAGLSRIQSGERRVQ
jgi:1-acyl-sn-glycerol-3-phosphate acyltransferase